MELFTYHQASIVRAERNYEGNRWVVYDRQYRREALARKDLNWSMPDSRLYNKALRVKPKLSLDIPIVCRRITSLRLAHAIQTAPCLAGSQNCYGGQVQPTQPHTLWLSKWPSVAGGMRTDANLLFANIGMNVSTAGVLLWPWIVLKNAPIKEVGHLSGATLAMLPLQQDHADLGFSYDTFI